MLRSLSLGVRLATGIFMRDPRPSPIFIPRVYDCLAAEPVHDAREMHLCIDTGETDVARRPSPREFPRRSHRAVLLVAVNSSDDLAIEIVCLPLYFYQLILSIFPKEVSDASRGLI